MSDSMREGSVFFKLSGLKGYTKTQGFTDQIGVLVFDTNQFVGGSKASSGNSQAMPITLTMYGGPHITSLQALSQQNEVKDEAILSQTQVVGKGGPKAIVTYKFKKVKIVKVHESGADGQINPPATMTFTCLVIEKEHKNFNADGTAGATTKAKWDIQKSTWTS